MSEVTKADLIDVRDQLTEAMEKGFQGVYDRQDKTNGRVDRLDKESTQHDERIRTLFRLERRQSDRRVKDSGDARISERDVRIFVAGGGGVAAVFLFFWKVFPLFLKAVTP
jgi:hypothetical protein